MDKRHLPDRSTVCSSVGFGLDFIPLFQERYDLVIPQKQLESGYLHPLFNYLLSADFRRQVQALSGYDTTHTGNQIQV